MHAHETCLLSDSYCSSKTVGSSAVVKDVAFVAQEAVIGGHAQMP